MSFQGSRPAWRAPIVLRAEEDNLPRPPKRSRPHQIVLTIVVVDFTMGGAYLVGYLLDHGFGYGPVFTLAGTFHVVAFLIILITIPVVAPLTFGSKLRHEAPL